MLRRYNRLGARSAIGSRGDDFTAERERLRRVMGWTPPEAICEAAQRPSMRFVSVKTEEQQANGIVFRARDLLVRQRTQCVNALRGHLFEYGYTFPQGITHVDLPPEEWTPGYAVFRSACS